MSGRERAKCHHTRVGSKSEGKRRGDASCSRERRGDGETNTGESCVFRMKKQAVPCCTAGLRAREIVHEVYRPFNKAEAGGRRMKNVTFVPSFLTCRSLLLSPSINRFSKRALLPQITRSTTSYTCRKPWCLFCSPTVRRSVKCVVQLKCFISKSTRTGDKAAKWVKRIYRKRARRVKRKGKMYREESG